jgi:hypothetical protein
MAGQRVFSASRPWDDDLPSDANRSPRRAGVLSNSVRPANEGPIIGWKTVSRRQ